MSEFERRFTIGWAEVDANGHMRNSAYLDLCSDVRMMFFADRGMAMTDFGRLGIGPVVAGDEVRYFRELKLLEEIRVNLALAGLSLDGSRFRIRNEVFKSDGVLAARITSDGGWLDLAARRLVAPPAPLRAALDAMIRTPDFAELPGSIR